MNDISTMSRTEVVETHLPTTTEIVFIRRHIHEVGPDSIGVHMLGAFADGEYALRHHIVGLFADDSESLIDVCLALGLGGDIGETWQTLTGEDLTPEMVRHVQGCTPIEWRTQLLERDPEVLDRIAVLQRKGGAL